MEEFVEKTLEEWGFAEFKAVFKENDITDKETFCLLHTDKDIIKTLIPSCGKRLRFMEKYNNFSILERAFSSPSTSTASTVTLENFIDLEETDQDNVQILATYDSNDTENIDAFLMPPPPKIAKTDANILIEVRDQSSLNSVFINGLEGFLQRSVVGKSILAHKSKLNKALRKQLVDLIVDYLLEKYQPPKQEAPQCDFMTIAKEIEFIFSGEMASIYFRAYKPKDENIDKQQCAGKLWSKWNNKKRVLSKLTADTDKGSVKPSEETYEPSGSESIALEYLRHNITPYEEIKQYWDLTYNARKMVLQKSQIVEYFDNFRYLKQPDGYLLLIEDFNKLYPERENIIYEKWPQFKNDLTALYSEKGHKQNFDKDDEVLLSLPLLFEITNLKVGKKARRLSIVEVQKNFIQQLPAYGDIQHEIDKKRTALIQEKGTLQPFLIYCDTDESCYLHVNDVIYPVDNLVKGIDIALKVFFTLDLQYPKECAHVWTFLQKYLYNIMTPQDKSFNSVEILISEIKSVQPK